MFYFQLVKSESIINSSYNSRLDLYAEHVVRGDITAADGTVLAKTTVNDDGSETREYPYGRMFAHVVGYMNNGKGGLESQYNFNLLRSHSFFLTQIINDLKNEKNTGDTLVTTLDYDVQKTAYDALGDRDGAVVVMEPKTGKILPWCQNRTMIQYGQKGLEQSDGGGKHGALQSRHAGKICAGIGV